MLIRVTIFLRDVYRRRRAIKVWLKVANSLAFTHIAMSKRILFDYLCNFQPNIFPYLHTFCNVGFRRKIFLYTIWSREWSSGKLVEYESLRVSNGRIQMGLVGLKMVKLRVDMQVYSIRFQFSNREYHAIIEIVECESGRVAQKWSSASRICEYRSTRSFTIVEWRK